MQYFQATDISEEQGITEALLLLEVRERNNFPKDSEETMQSLL